ncbi:MAG: MMPL family transporter, partial [Actinomycetia bacterium]|nr:MMPL family transporter [Actinomycetes bacterium]
QGSAGGPFIFLAVGFIVLLVGALLRSYWAAVVVTSALGLTLLAFNGLLGVLGIKMGSSLISFVIPITLIAFGVDFFIHAAGRVGEEQDEPGHRSAGYRTGMAAVFPALTLAVATSIAAFLSNVASGIEAIVQFGIAAAIGLVLAYVTLGWMAPRALVGIGQHVGPGPAPGRFRLARRVLGLVVMVA